MWHFTYDAGTVDRTRDNRWRRAGFVPGAKRLRGLKAGGLPGFNPPDWSGRGGSRAASEVRFLPVVTIFVNAFNENLLATDESGLTESCDVCNRVILNWTTVGDAATLAEDGQTILCRHCADLI